MNNAKTADAPTNAELSLRDLSLIWHPCSQMKEYLDDKLAITPIKSGAGAWLEDYDGSRYLDAISGWWVNLFGHGEPRIAKAIAQQAAELEHCVFAGFTHIQAINLAEKITRIAPRGLEKVFFADNGSAAVEVALKMAFHFFAVKGENRPIVVSLSNSYHGETLGALSAGDCALYKKVYEPLLFRAVQAKSPALFSLDEAVGDLRRVLSENAGAVCAVIVEPLVQCAGAMAMYDAAYLTELRGLCDQYGALLIADEIAVGFGRSGTMFACEQAAISPDLMTLSKGLTGGFLPLALTLVSSEIYSAFLNDDYGERSFLHSHSYSGNPIACAAANATLDIFDSSDTLNNNLNLARSIDRRLDKLRAFENVSGARRRGMIAAFEIRGRLSGREETIFITNEARKRGIILRPLGNTLYTMPPYVIKESEIDFLFDAIEDILSLYGK